MISHVWSLICSRSILDKDSNNISLIECLEQLSVPSPPANPDGKLVIPLTFEIVSLWTRSVAEKPSRGTCRLEVYSPSDTVIHEQRLEVDLTTYQRVRSRQRFNGLPFGGSGTYRFKITVLSDEHGEPIQVASIPLVVTSGSPPASEIPTPHSLAN